MKKYLEIGPFGRRISDQWDTMDMVAGDDVDIVGTLGERLPIPDATYAVIYASHVLEHVPWQKTIFALQECWRILQPKGWIEVWVPDFAKIVEAYQSWDVVADGWLRKNPEGNMMTWVNGRLFYGDRGQGSLHKATFDYQHLSYCLQEANFHHIERLQKPRKHDHGWINLGVKGYK